MQEKVGAEAKVDIIVHDDRSLLALQVCVKRCLVACPRVYQGHLEVAWLCRGLRLAGLLCFDVRSLFTIPYLDP